MVLLVLVIIIVALGVSLAFLVQSRNAHRRQIEASISKIEVNPKDDPQAVESAIRKLETLKAKASAGGFVDQSDKADKEIQELRQLGIQIARTHSGETQRPESRKVIEEALSEAESYSRSNSNDLDGIIHKFEEAKSQSMSSKFPDLTAKAQEGIRVLQDRKMVVSNVQTKAPESPKEAPEPPTKEPHKSNFFTGNGYDLVIFLSKDEDLLVSVDPDVLSFLLDTKIELSEKPDKVGIDLLESLLSSRGFIFLKNIPLSPDFRVTFITTQGMWTYLDAIDKIDKGQVTAGYKKLKTTEGDSSGIGTYCRGLAKTIDIIEERNVKARKWGSDIRESIEKLKRLENRPTSGRLFVPPPEQPYNEYERRQKEVKEEINALCNSVPHLYEELVRSNEPIFDRFAEARTLGLNSEAYFLFKSLEDSFVYFQATIDELARNDLMEADASKKHLPRELQETKTSLEQGRDEVAAQLKTALATAGRDNTAASHAFGQVYSTDRANWIGRVGVGYYHLRRYVESVNYLFGVASTNLVEHRFELLDKEFRQHGKHNYLQIANVLRDQTSQGSEKQSAGKIGTAYGLAVTSSGGILFPLSVSIGPVRRDSQDYQDLKSNSWGKAVLREFEDCFISFTDYGKKDLTIFDSATRAYRWVTTSGGESLNRDKGLRLEFHHLWSGKGGDSAGVTIACAAYSALKRIPLRPNVAMTGSIRSDGSVKAVGGVWTKVMGVIDADAIEVVIIPKENEADLSLLSPEILCKLIIIVADDIQTYLKYATEAKTDASSRGGSETEEMIQSRKLLAAQILILMGKHEVAQIVLKDIVSHNSEIYSARRLLELMETYWNKSEEQNPVDWKAAQKEASEVLRRIATNKP